MSKIPASSMHISARYEAGDADPALLVLCQAGTGGELGQDDSKEFLRVVYSTTAVRDDVIRNLRQIADVLEEHPSMFENES